MPNSETFLGEHKGYHRTEVRWTPVGKAIHLRCNVIDLLAFERDCSWAWGSAVGMACFELHHSE